MKQMRLRLAGEASMLDYVQMQGHPMVRLDLSRDGLLTSAGQALLRDQHLLPGEGCQDLFARVASHYGDDAAHAQRLYDYMSRLWLMPAEPVLSNAGTARGLPVSCFVEAADNLDGVLSLWNEYARLEPKEGSAEVKWDNLRPLGAKESPDGAVAAPIPAMRVMDSLTQAITGSPLQRGSAAVYLPVHHPEIEEFTDLRHAPGHGPDRKLARIHHGILVTDAFMRAVEADGPWALTSPRDGAVVRVVGARALWQRILSARLESGEPCLVFADHVNNARPEHHKLAGLEVRASNITTEIMLPTGVDQHGRQRTAVCCMASLNLERWWEWRDHPLLIEDAMRLLDNVLQEFIDQAPARLERARYSALRGRSVGLGVVGFHSFLQSQGVPFESVVAKVWNKRIFKQVRAQADQASRMLAEERGPCPDAGEYGVAERFSHKLAVAPAAGIGVICGVSPGIEPLASNLAEHDTSPNLLASRNPHLQRLLAGRGQDTEAVWAGIAANNGSVQHLASLTEQERAVFRTAFELDQRWVVEHAADRAPFICQSQSVRLYLTPHQDADEMHRMAWKKGVKSLYHCRTKPLQGVTKDYPKAGACSKQLGSERV